MAQRPAFLSSDPAGLPARRAALRLMDAVLRRGETLDVAEHAALQGIRNPADKALARAIVGEALRWLVDLDALIDSATRMPLAPDAKARAVLRLMLAQWLRLDTPPHAVVATGLELLDGGPRRLAHGVFSTLNKQAVTLPQVPTLPDRVQARWGALVAEVAPGLASPPPLDLTLKDPAATAEWAGRLGGTSLMPGHVRLARGTRVEDLAGYAEGAWWVQDLAASLPARLLGPGEGRSVLDLCCAPGGKTLQLAAAGWQVTGLDSSAKRLQRVEQNLARTGLAADLVQADARTWGTAERFDAVLLDAPCTATGTCRRHPDVLHRIGQGHITDMAALQADLLVHAQSLLRPGGMLVYATCSLEPQEGEAQAATVPLTPAPVTEQDLPAGIAPTPEGWVRTHPGMLAQHGGLDGFFIARWHLSA
ncbi:RsmB/NOP family class I SAM-dependent RNA methyltransferase [Alteraurantiacibacter buctensis]|uniref:Methyltransferase domain-containing protein n=1 Tax=Alteraurantiacibacter buctensis TaxID=1503981 RepID=A0A844YVR6_9SPHN|nr:RsmB/NOP family class I SAM-dependent RNA methyltransferase [Alteraurantiacibacter buctensis]MXO70167.1 methyltransferase domain-containing protein [Alteraurantiacibacter buctensis]